MNGEYPIEKKAIAGIFFVISLIILATFANLTGWSNGADKILTAALVLMGTIPIEFRKTNKNK